MRYKDKHESLPELKFDKNRKRVKFCPCGRSNNDGKFVPYVGYADKGYCHSCGKTILPDINGYANAASIYKGHTVPSFIKKETISTIPIEMMKATHKLYENNYFVQYLRTLFDDDTVKQLIEKYHIGTSKHWQGATIFWQVDLFGKVRTGKIMLYNPITGKRVKKPTNYIDWVHNVSKQTEFELSQCFFGEDLLADKSKIVAIVESEKTAIIASVYCPQFIWIATAGKEGLNAQKCQVLKGRSVVLYPDLNAFEKWSNKAKELSHIADITVSEYLEVYATDYEKSDGLDLADFLVKDKP